MTQDDAIARGAQFAEDNLKIIEAAFGGQAAMAYAGAMACGARNWVAQRHGTRAAFNLMTGLADDCVTMSLDAQAEKRRGL